ncbi:MAG: 4-hydroxybenzoate octaprenyltransferase [Alphaproteobacteria bacterium]
MAKVQAYARLARLRQPTGFFLCLAPALWALSLAPYPFSCWLFWKIMLGAALVRGAGCTVNDVIDQDLDKQVQRTRTRPLPAGLISTKEAWFFFTTQILAAFLVLLTLNPFTIFLGMAIVIPIGIYPFLKRLTYWPQVFLAFIFNWGVLMAWSSVMNGLSGSILLLYFATVFSTLGYDTVYAFQDYRDDEQAGIKAASRRLGYKKGLLFIQASYFLFLVLLSFSFYKLKGAEYLSLPLASSVYLFYALNKLRLKQPSDCHSFFQANGILGLIIWAGLLILNFVNS